MQTPDNLNNGIRITRGQDHNSQSNTSFVPEGPPQHNSAHNRI